MQFNCAVRQQNSNVPSTLDTFVSVSAFVERYMSSGWPRDSFANYDKADLLANVHRLKDKEFLLVHGTADQKVNVQHSMLLMKAMTEANIPFRLQLYPDGDHSLLDEQLHLYKTMEEFFAKCFQLEDEQNEDIIELPITRVIKGGRRIITNDD
jgi:acetyl esterase/lipase